MGRLVASNAYGNMPAFQCSFYPQQHLHYRQQENDKMPGQGQENITAARDQSRERRDSLAGSNGAAS